ncbi:MAG: response regulator [Verrucomicrobia bacterium]|nr:response regulator [Verrucomicrobiota bacterium]
MKILVADDSLVVLRLLEMSLKKDGHELVPARTGAAAWQELQRPDGPRIAILDWQMPDISGVEVCQRIRAWESKHRPHLIMLTSLGGREDTVAAFDAGVDDYIVKPFDRDILLARLRAAARAVQHQEKLLEEIRLRDEILRASNTPAALAPAQEPAPAPLAASSREAPPSTRLSPPPASAAPAPLPDKGVNGTPVIHQVLSSLCPSDEMEGLVGQTLAEMMLGEGVPVKDPAQIEAFRPEIDVVHFMILPEKSVWLDLLLETNLASALALYQLFTGSSDTAVPENDLVDVIGETLNMIQGRLKSTFKSKGAELIVPVVPHSLPVDQVLERCHRNAAFTRALYSLPGIDLRFTVFAYSSPLHRKRLIDIKLANVLAEPLRPPDNDDLVLINKGTLLNGRALMKVNNLAEYAPHGVTHPVFEPSPLSMLLPEN